MRRIAGSFAFLALFSGCGGSAQTSGGRHMVFTPEWQNDGGKSIQAVYARVEKSALPSGAPVAVGVTQSGIVGIGLDGKGKWSHAGRVDELPALTGDVAVATSAGTLFAVDAKSGKELWKIALPGRVLRGAGDDGSTTVASLGASNGGAAMLIAVARDGSVKQKLEMDVDIGIPAVQGGVAFVPWQSQYVSAINLATGDESGRLLMRETVSRAQNIGGTLFFGELGLLRFDSKVGASASGQGSSVKLPERELPGKPVWFPSGVATTPAFAAAREKIRLFAHPAEQGDALGISGGRYVATYFRVVMGLDAKDGSLRWARTFDKDVLGGAAGNGGFALCDASGKVTLVDSNGGEANHADFGQPLLGCTVQTGAAALPAGKALPSLPEQIAKAIEVRQSEMATAQRFLLRELGAMQEPIVTKALVDLASDPRTPEFLLGDARQLLAARRNGAEYMLAALEQHYDFLSDVLRSPPVGPIADALAAMNETKGAAPLAKHLNDAANAPEDIERAAKALSKLASPAQVDDLKTFFALYRATADDKELVNAVLSVAEGLLRVGGDDGKRLIAEAAEDPFTQPEVRAGLATLAPPKADKPAPTKPEPEKKPAASKG